MKSNSSEQTNTTNNASRTQVVKFIIGLLIIIAAYLVACIVLQTSNPIGVVASNSMQPTLSRGDMVLIQGTAPAKIDKGDIITFSVSPVDQAKYHYPSTVTHRVTEVELNHNGLSFRTQGDNTQPDPFIISSRAVKGTPLFTIPKVGYAILMLQSRQGLILIIGLFLIWLIYSKGSNFMQKTQTTERTVLGTVVNSFP